MCSYYSKNKYSRNKLNSLQEFLLLDEKNDEQSDNDIKDYLLRYIDQNITKGKLLVIAGPTGSGKSSLLKSLALSDIEETLGRVSYASQEAWLFSGTIASNILFYQADDTEKYLQVVKVCALMKDLLELPEKDKTLVGDRRANLSGGQRARINLARAVYKDAEVYLIDDVLASVDVHVGKQIMDECIKGYLKGKLRILVSHNPEHLQQADEIIIMKNGGVHFHGPYADLIASGYRLPDWRPVAPTTEVPPAAKTGDSVPSDLELAFIEKTTEQPENPNALLAPTIFMCWKYFGAGGSISTLLCLGLSLLLAQASVSGCDYWMANWMMRSAKSSVDDKVLAKTSDLYLFGGLTLTSIVMWTASSILFYKVCINASRNLHNRMFSSLMDTSLRFFQLNSSGRILNRFSKDTGIIDETLPSVTLDAVQGILMMVAVVIQLTVVSPRLALMSLPYVIPMVLLLFSISVRSLLFAQNNKRDECAARSAIYSHVQSSIAGLTTIRSARNRPAIREKFDLLQANYFVECFKGTFMSSADGLYIDVAVTIFLFIVIVGLTIRNRNGMEALIISQTLMLYGKLQFGVRQATEMMVQMVSVERILKFIDLKSEGPVEKDDDIPKEWPPSRGKIEFKNVHLKYSNDEDPVLKDINFTINPQEKIGIVGRTGAGKTSLVAALLRLVESNGSILIDDVDTKTVGLRELRRRISVVPQEPVLFTATVRDNLDPEKIYSDETLWGALRDVELGNRFDSLAYPIASGGDNLSVGEKQLLCLARAVLAGNKIVVLDEATASVDSATEEIIQKTIKRLFHRCTVVTVAHRLNTIFESDRILVVDQGKIVEFDSPSILIERKDGHFFKMVNA